MSQNSKIGLIAFFLFSVPSLLFGSWVLFHILLLILLLITLPVIKLQEMNGVKSCLVAIPCSLVITIAVYFWNPELRIFEVIPKLLGQI